MSSSDRILGARPADLSTQRPVAAGIVIRSPRGRSRIAPGDPSSFSTAAAPVTATSRLAVDPSLAAELDALRAAAAEQGYTDGLARAESELGATISAAAALAAGIEQAAPAAEQAIARAVVTLALAMARRVLAAEAAADPAVLVRAVEAGLESIDGSPQVNVLLHPDAVEPVRRAWEVRHGTTTLGRRWTFEGTSSLPPGGCVVHYDHGSIDVGLETQLALIGEHLDEVLTGDAPVEERVA